MASWVQRTARAIERGRAEPLAGAALTAPLFVTYHLGVLAIDVRDGVDWVSWLTLWLVDESVPAYAGVTLAVAGALVLAAWVQERRGRLRPVALLPTIAESSLWAIGMAITIGWATHAMTHAITTSVAMTGLLPGRLGALPLGAGVTPALDPFDKLVLAAGAGFHEELVFRVGVLSGGAWLLERGFDLGRARALLLAVPVSALAFAVVHHLGPHGEPLAWMSLLFRSLSGVFLAGVYLVRGFAVAAYTHTLYDALVFFVL